MKLGAHVMVQTAPTREHDVREKLLELPYVTDVQLLFGEYDLMIEMAGNSPEQIGYRVMNIRDSVEGVIETKTLPHLSLYQLEGIKT